MAIFSSRILALGVHTGRERLQRLLERLGLMSASSAADPDAVAAARLAVTGPAPPSPRPRPGRSPAFVSCRRSGDGVHTTRGVIAGGSCGGVNSPPSGFFGTVSMIDAAGGGRMAIDIKGAFQGVPMTCHVTAKRTSAVDPGQANPCP
jgi:hypothetical protein